MNSSSNVEQLKQELLYGKGYVVFRNVIPASTALTCRYKALKKANDEAWDGWPGVRSKRIRDNLEWGGEAYADVLNKTCATLMPVVEAVLGPSSWLTSFQTLVLYPYNQLSAEEEDCLCSGGLHNDFPYGEFKEVMDKEVLGPVAGNVEGRPMGHGNAGWQFPEGFKPGQRAAPHTLQTIWITDEFTRKRGATRLLPGSQVAGLVPNSGAGPDWDQFTKGAVTVEASPGDVLMYVGAVWHTISVNRGLSPRVALLGQWSTHHAAPLEAHAWMTSLWVRPPSARAVEHAPRGSPGGARMDDEPLGKTATRCPGEAVPVLEKAARADGAWKASHGMPRARLPQWISLGHAHHYTHIVSGVIEIWLAQLGGQG
ncbi:hypothetical protein CYMTET_12790 [Cymbomonas tetramitiformis]|uniref:Uncharacterized protein n=1 Tax=Cymbomonas tetramitiformis TaxID=36881 RepID=A0AAE0LC30_9CHLO|nr:hypothetical protein CYMTET_12790 [Cymbomonas tetramitiformis]